MKGFQPLFLGIFGIFAFSWLGMTVVPNLQIGGLDPQSDEEGTDIYPMPGSGMALRGAQVYAENGCVYCHTQQVRPEYGGSDLERGWGQRRSAPRDYIFQPVVMLGKMRTGPDLANVGHRPAMGEADAASPAAGAASAANGATAAATGATAAASSATPAANGAASAANGAASAANGAASAANGATAAANSATAAANSATPAATSATAAATSAAPAANTPATQANASLTAGNNGAPAVLPPAGTQPSAAVPTSAPAMVGDVQALTKDGKPIPYSAAWHHRHLYNPRSVAEYSNMPPYRFLYQKRRISGVISPDAINFAGDSGEQPEAAWEIVPSYDAKCLVAYLMSLDQSHALKEAKAPATVAAAAPAGAPAAAQEAKK